MTSRQIDVLRKITEERKDKLKKGDELPLVSSSSPKSISP